MFFLSPKFCTTELFSDSNLPIIILMNINNYNNYINIMHLIFIMLCFSTEIIAKDVLHCNFLILTKKTD